MKINWQVRMLNKTFWVSLIPAVLVLVSMIASVFGYSYDFGDLGNKLIAVVGAVFTLLSILGVVADPTTKGLSDSARALDYINPADNAK